MKKTLLIFCIFSLLFAPFTFLNCNPQADTVKVAKKHNPKAATSLALIPGAGQIYNKKYWKLPIVYGGMGATGFLIYFYQRENSMYRKEYVARANNDTINFNPKLANIEDVNNILEYRNFYRRNMEICIAVCALVYALSILDACVDAHLFYYDISDNLSMTVRPKLNVNPVSGTASPCLALVFKF